MRTELPVGRVLPLSSRRMMATHIKAIAGSMKLPTKTSTDEVRQLIEGKLYEEGHDVL